MKKTTLILLILAILPALTLANDSGPQFRKKNYLDGNNIRTVFYNYGLIGDTPPEISMEWPQGTGNEYYFDIIPMIGCRYITTPVDTIISVVNCDSPRGWHDGPPGMSNVFWGFEPQSGYANQYMELSAMRHDPDTWPPAWTEWPSILPDGAIIPDAEAMFVMDDANDMEFHPAITPDPTNPERGGLGLKVLVYVYQWDIGTIDDVLLCHYRIYNEGTLYLTDMSFGYVVGTLAGGRGDSFDDLVDYDLVYDTVFFWDDDDNGSVGWVPLTDEVNIGVSGQKLIQTPLNNAGDELGLTGLAYFSPPGSVRMNNDPQLYERLIPGYFSDPPTEGEDGDYIFGSGFFELAPGDSTDVIIATCFGIDEDDFYATAQAIDVFVESGYRDFSSIEIEADLPSNYEIVNGMTTIFFSIDTNDDISINVELSSDAGHNWEYIARNIPNNGMYGFATTDYPDGQLYKLRFTAFNASDFGYLDSESPFLIRNTTNALPPVIVLDDFPSGPFLSGSIPLTWSAADADGQPLTIDIELSLDAGNSWYSLTENCPNDGYFWWDSTQWSNAETAVLRFTVDNGSLTTSVLSEPFELYNATISEPENYIIHESGDADAVITFRVVDPTALTGHDYRLTFSEDNTTKFFTVTDLQTDEVVLDQIPLSETLESAPFDGLRLTIRDARLLVNNQESGWNPESLTDIHCRLFEFIADNMEFIPTEEDLVLTILPENSVTTTPFQGTASGWPFNFEAQEVNFTIQNIQNGAEVPFAFADYTGNEGQFAGFSASDDVFLLVEIEPGIYHPSWQIALRSSIYEPILPEPGDYFQIIFYKPLHADDVYLIQTEDLLAIESEPVTTPSANLGQNFPNPFNPVTTIPFSISSSGAVKLQVYDITGRLVKTLVDSQLSVGDYEASWAGKNEENQGVSSGIYVYQLITPDGKILTRKLTLLK